MKTTTGSVFVREQPRRATLSASEGDELAGNQPRCLVESRVSASAIATAAACARVHTSCHEPPNSSHSVWLPVQGRAELGNASCFPSRMDLRKLLNVLCGSGRGSLAHAGGARVAAPWLRVALLLAALASACEREQKSLLSEPIEARTAVRSGIGIPSGAAEAIAQRRCDLAERCDRIGPGKPYDRRVECEFRHGAELSEELNSIDCPRGVDEGRLGACLRELELVTCADIDRVSRRPECLASAICEAGPTPSAVRPPITYEPQ
jgi:hypothetical protein